MWLLSSSSLLLPLLINELLVLLVSLLLMLISPPSLSPPSSDETREVDDKHDESKSEQFPGSVSACIVVASVAVRVRVSACAALLWCVVCRGAVCGWGKVWGACVGGCCVISPKIATIPRFYSRPQHPTTPSFTTNT